MKRSKPFYESSDSGDEVSTTSDNDSQLELEGRIDVKSTVSSDK